MGFGKKSSAPAQQTPTPVTTVTNTAGASPIQRVTGVQQEVANQNTSPQLLAPETEEQKRSSVLGGGGSLGMT